MNRNQILGLVFLLCCAVQIGVPASMIVGHERTLDHGQVYRFLCAPVDPVDAFRGRYVALNFAQSQFSGPVAEHLVSGSTAYATIEEDAEGYASIVAILDEPPEGVEYVQVRLRWRNGDTAMLQLPFDRYYMEESMAPEAEGAYNRRTVGEKAWVTVRIHDGHAVLEELYVEGLPIREYLEQ